MVCRKTGISCDAISQTLPSFLGHHPARVRRACSNSHGCLWPKGTGFPGHTDDPSGSPCGTPPNYSSQTKKLGTLAWPTRPASPPLTLSGLSASCSPLVATCPGPRPAHLCVPPQLEQHLPECATVLTRLHTLSSSLSRVSLGQNSSLSLRTYSRSLLYSPFLPSGAYL